MRILKYVLVKILIPFISDLVIFISNIKSKNKICPIIIRVAYDSINYNIENKFKNIEKLFHLSGNLAGSTIIPEQ